MFGKKNCFFLDFIFFWTSCGNSCVVCDDIMGIAAWGGGEGDNWDLCGGLDWRSHFLLSSILLLLGKRGLLDVI